MWTDGMDQGPQHKYIEIFLTGFCAIPIKKLGKSEKTAQNMDKGRAQDKTRVPD